MTDDRIITRLRKLIRLGESPNEQEASNALRAAADLAAKYHVKLASIDASADAGSQLGKRVGDVVLWGRRQRKYRWQLAHVVARAWGCAPWTSSRLTITMSVPPSEADVELAFDWLFDLSEHRPTYTIDGCTIVLERVFGNLPDVVYPHWFPRPAEFVKAEPSELLVMFGRRDSAEAAIYVYHVLLAAVDSLAKQHATGRRGLNDARFGLVYGLSARLDEMFDDADSDEDYKAVPADDRPKSTALVLSEAGDEAVRYLEDCFGTTAYSGGRAHEIKDHASFNAGVRAADKIDIPDPSSGKASLGGARALGVGSDRQLG